MVRVRITEDPIVCYEGGIKVRIHNLSLGLLGNKDKYLGEVKVRMNGMVKMVYKTYRPNMEVYELYKERDYNSEVEDISYVMKDEIGSVLQLFNKVNASYRENMIMLDVMECDDGLECCCIYMLDPFIYLREYCNKG